MKEKQIIKLDNLMQKIKGIDFGKIDFVVAIAQGGILPGILCAKYLNVNLEIIYINFRNENHIPKFSEPKITRNVKINADKKNILLVDDVANTGATLNKAKELLVGANIKTAVISGNADISFFGKHDRCILWPWEN